MPSPASACTRYMNSLTEVVTVKNYTNEKSDQLDHHSACTTPAIAYSGCAIFALVGFQHMNKRNDYAGATGSERMSQRNGTAMCVHFCRVELHAFGIFNTYHGKGFV